MSPSKFSLAGVSPSMAQANVNLPTSLDDQCCPVSIFATLNFQQTNAFSQEPVMSTSGLVPGSVASR